MMIRKINERCELIDSKTWHRLYEDAISTDAVYANYILEWFFQQDAQKHIKNIYFFCGNKLRDSLMRVLCTHFLQHGIRCHEGFSERAYSAKNSVLFDLVNGFPFEKPNAHQIDMIRLMNTSTLPIISLECPSGLNPNTGGMLGSEICRAHYTLCTFAFMQGLWTGLGKNFTGNKVLILDSAKKAPVYLSKLMHSQQMQALWPCREEYAHKGSFKKVICISGQKTMFGATLLAAKAALLVGAGLVEVFHPHDISIPYAQYPEVIWHPVASVSQIPCENYADAIWVVGPGLGNDVWAMSVWREVIKYDYRMVIDASALRWLAAIRTQKKNWIITPHPGEAGELLGISAAEVQNNRYCAITQLQHQTQMTVVLKGSGTLVMGKQNDISVCPHGHAGMASPGLGDVLTGIIAGLYAQIDDATKASLLGVWIHAVAGDRIYPIATASHLIHELQFHLQDVLCT
jgi:ADP-dependent NAD(P)H-hydrate dehydratase / NAD(P)H-hydrate epimerase